jgi:hypothetical protein
MTNETRSCLMTAAELKKVALLWTTFSRIIRNCARCGPFLMRGSSCRNTGRIVVPNPSPRAKPVASCHGLPEGMVYLFALFHALRIPFPTVQSQVTTSPAASRVESPTWRVMSSFVPISKVNIISI